MPTNIIIRQAVTGDAAELARVGWCAFDEAFGEHPKNHPDDMKSYRAEYFTPERIEADLREADTVYLIAELENEIAGYAKIRFDSRENCVAAGKTLELCRLYALDKFIGTGVGRALMLEYLDAARRNACEICWLGVWEFNFRAQRFYEKFGFEKCGEHVFQLGSDPQIDWVMQRKL